MNSIVDISKMLGGKIAENSPTILSSLGAVGVVSTAVLAAKATPKALQLLDKERSRRMFDGDEDDILYGITLSIKDTIRIGWKPFLPAIGVGVASIFCILQANTISQRRMAAIATAYSLAEVTLKEYQDKVIETIGRNKELKIRDEIAGDRVKANSAGSNEVMVTGKGEVLCYDAQTGRYFKSSVETIRQAVNNLNARLLREDYITLNEMFCDLGLKSIKNGDELGWHLDKGLIEVEFSTQLSDSNEPCLVLGYKLAPKYLK